MGKGNDWWKHGEKKVLADFLGVSNQHINAIFSRLVGVSPKKARFISLAITFLFGKHIAPSEIVFNKSSDHPAFKPGIKKRVIGCK